MCFVDWRGMTMKGLKRSAALLLTMIMVLTLTSVPAFAKTKTIKMKGAAYTSRTADMSRSAKTVKKRHLYFKDQ